MRNGAERSAYKKFPFRVLMVFKNAERRNNTAARLLAHTPPILSLVCLSTFEEVICNPLGKIWIRPVDFRDATKGTPFATVQPSAPRMVSDIAGQSDSLARVLQQQCGDAQIR